jgi:plastocyanin
MSSAPRYRLIALIVAAALGTGACVAANPGWTYTPAPPATPAASVTASGSAAASAGASGADGSPAASESGGGGGGGGVVEISALNIAFEQSSVTVPAGKPFQIAFNNKDNGVPHNVAIHDANGAEKFKGEIVTGPATRMYDVPALDPGTYTFVCNVHPNMTGTLTAQ